MPQQNGFGYDGTYASRSSDSESRNNNVNTDNDDVTHSRIVAD
jgi:hypothetical protein